MTSLHLLRFDFNVPGLFGLAKDQGLVQPSKRGPVVTEDMGYILHAAFSGLFGEYRPKLFTKDPSPSAQRDRRLPVLAYSDRDLSELREHAQTYADPLIYNLVDWDRAASKKMPGNWRTGQRLGFQLHACPTVRTSSSTPERREGAEVDAYLAEVWRSSADVHVDRVKVYSDWLKSAFERNGGASLENASVESFHSAMLLRRTQGHRRNAPVIRKPDVVFSGSLMVTSPEGFEDLLRCGIGRHRAFGYGMMLLKPERRP
jgi:CRISPR system Cascade subunit CasE